MVRSLFLPALLFLVAESAAQEQPPVPPVEVDDCPGVSFSMDAKRWAEPKIVVAPEYPAAELAAGRTGIVDVEAHVPREARISAIHRLISEPKNIAFEKAVTDVVKYWIFNPETNCDCDPVGADVKLRVWFEIREGKPVISVSSPPRNSERKSGGPELKNRAAVTKALGLHYPRQARRAGMGADVYAAVHVNPVSGGVRDVEIKWIRTDFSPADHFGRALSDALTVAEYSLPDTDKRGKALACLSVSYRIGN